MNNYIVQHHVWHEYNNQHRHGTLAAKRVGDHVYVGMSSCSPKDNYVKTNGAQIALSRCSMEVDQAIRIHPNQIARPIWNQFLVRVMKYFKDVPYQNIHF